MISCSIASPYGPLFAEFTEYESRKYGVACSKLTAMKRGKPSDDPRLVEVVARFESRHRIDLTEPARARRVRR